MHRVASEVTHGSLRFLPQSRSRQYAGCAVSDRALHEICNAPFHRLAQAGGAPSIMGAYPKINGTFACENVVLLDDLRSKTGWHGFMMSDFLAGEDPVASVNAGIDSTTLYSDFPREAFSDGRISVERLDQAVKRTLYVLFDSGLFDDPVGGLDRHKPVSSPEHKALARRTDEEGIVLLKNRNYLLPLPTERIDSSAIIGCVNRDVIAGVEGSSYVELCDYLTPLDAITNAVEVN